MKETRKMLDFYKAKIKINSVGMVMFVILLIAVAAALLIAVPQIWWVSLILFGLDVLFAIIFYFAVKAMKNKVQTLEREIAEAEKSKSE